MSSEQVHKLTHQMRLFGMHASVERRANEALSAQMHPMEFMRLVLEDELLSRKDRVGKMLTTRAKFRIPSELEDWDQTYDRGLPKPRLKELGQLAFYERKENLLLFGKTGEGKTHLAVALGRRLCREGVQVVFMPMNFLFEEVGAAKAAGKYLSFVRQLTKAKVLLLDDFGLRNYTHEEATVLVDVLEDRYRNGVVIVTSQVDDKGWKKLFEDPVISEAIVDRLLHPSQKIVLKGGSYRERLQQK
jgi:DNA replication protein DnaC